MRHPLRAAALGLAAVALCGPPRQAAAEGGANKIETYLARWWGTEGSERGRPIYQVARVDNGRVELWHAIVKGRELGDYRLPYWPIRSFLSIVNRPAELPHRGYATFTLRGKPHRAPFIVHEGFEFARSGDADVLKITNRGSKSPVLMEHFFVIEKGSPVIGVVARITNLSDGPIRSVRHEIVYDQSFNWSHIASGTGEYRPMKPGTAASALGFFAFSAGLGRGYELVAGTGCTGQYRATPRMNGWQVLMRSEAKELAPGAWTAFRYTVRALRNVPAGPPQRAETLPTGTLLALPFRKVAPTQFRKAPVQLDGRVLLPQVVGGLKRPKIRGLNLRAGLPQALKDLATLKDWGCNLVITHLGRPEQTRTIVEAGHRLGIEMFVSGRGSFRQGPPRFETLYSKPLPPSQQADSHGQDEDHYYWYAIRPTRDFQADLGKPMSHATQEERVLYWSRCFVDKWRGVLASVRPHAPRGGIWFYSPSPCVAHVDPLDYHGVFFREVAKLGEPLTVFPFYYGVEHSQAEYMVRRWKDAGVHRVAFLPMRGFMVRPSQFVRAITAARRGRADGTCGFAFPVGAETPGNEWQWKSVMLAAWANFPTPDLNAYCLIEEPAELVEALAKLPVAIHPHGTDVAAFVARLSKLLPNPVDSAGGPMDGRPDVLRVEILGQPRTQALAAWPRNVQDVLSREGKGFIQMAGRVVTLWGTDAAGLANAIRLFTRFAELARAERGR